MKTRASLFVVVGLILISTVFTGCGGGGGGGGASPVGPIVTADPTTPTSPTTAGTSSVTFTISGVSTSSLRASSLRASMRFAVVAPYASATLYVDNVVAQQKTASVVNGSVTLSFTGVKDSGTAKLDLELVGCNVGGAAFFTGVSQITQNTVVVLTPTYPVGGNKTYDGKLLVEIGNDNLGKITFNEVGQPIGFAYDGYVTNYETNQKYFKVDDLIAQDNRIRQTDLAWYDGKIYLGGQETLTEVNPTTGAFTVRGDPNFPVLTGTGDTLINATFKSIGDLQVVGNKLVIQESFTHFATLENGTFSAYTLSFDSDRFSILDNGDIWVFYCWENNIPYNVKLNGSSVGEKVSFALTNDPTLYANGNRGTTSAVSYSNGVLFAREDAIYYWNGTDASIWLTPASLGINDSAPNFFIYKNSVGQVYVCSEVANKIWKVE